MALQRSRSDRAFERLYRRHVDDVYRYAFALLANRADAEDVTQTAFLNAYRAFENGQNPERPLNWLIAITHNVCRQRFRAAARRPSEVVLDRELAAEPFDEERGFRRRDIGRAFSQLTFGQRAALAMRELEGRSYREIAAVLGVTEAAVETLIFRARRAFREQLEGSLSCSEAERAISRQVDGRLGGKERAELRAHLRACSECASLARRFRAQRAALKRLLILPLPQSLSSLSAAGGSSLAGGAALGTGLGVKAVALGASALLAAGVSTEIVTRSGRGSDRIAARAAPRSERPASSPRLAEQLAARPVPRPTAGKAVSAPAHKGTHIAGARGKPGIRGGKATHRLTTTARPTTSDVSATTTRTEIADKPRGRRRAHPAAASRGGADRHADAATHGRAAREKHAVDHLARTKKPPDAAKPAGAPDSEAPHPQKKDKAASGKAASGSVPPASGPPPWSSAGGAASAQTPTPGVPSASSQSTAAGPPGHIDNGPPADPGAQGSSKSKDAGPKNR
jgi:RNA polymerase sigma-70 factor (ECF subfamily)